MKRFIAIVIVILAIFAVVYFRRSASILEIVPTPTPLLQENSDPISPKKIKIPEEYATALESSANMARIKFTVPVDSKTVINSNVKVCTMSVSAGSGGTTSCELDTNIRLSFDPSLNTLTITEVNKSPENQGAIFRTGCAACAHVVEFQNIYTKDGQEMPKLSLFVY